MDAQGEMSKLGEKSFFARPEGKTGMVVMAAGFGAGAFTLYHFLPFLITLLENTLYAGLLGGALVVLSSPIWSTKVRTLTSYMFRSAMRKITGFFITIDPIGIMKNYIEDLQKNLSKMERQIANLRGQIQKLKDIIAKNKEKADHSLEIASVAKRTNNKAALTVNARQASRLGNSNEQLKALLTKLETLYKILLKLKDVSKLTVEDITNEVQVQEEKHEAMKASYGAFTSAMNILKGNGDQKALYEQAMEHVANDYAMKVGEIEDFMISSEGFLASVDLDNMVFEQNALKQLEELERKSDGLFGTPAGVSSFDQAEQSEVSALYR